MRRFSDKLRDNEGATILMALFALLLASLVCIVILGASVTTVKQSKVDQQHEQDMLILQSAGELIASNIGNDVVEIAYKKTTVTTKSNNVVVGAPTSTDEVYLAKGTCLIKEELKTAVREIIDNPYADYSTAQPLDIVLADTSSAGTGSGNLQVPDLNGQTVKMSFTLRCGEHDVQASGTGLDYQLVVTFDLMKSGEKSQTLYLKMRGKYTQGTESSSTTKTDESTEVITSVRIDTYSWGKPEFYLAGSEGA